MVFMMTGPSKIIYRGFGMTADTISKRCLSNRATVMRLILNYASITFKTRRIHRGKKKSIITLMNALFESTLAMLQIPTKIS